MKSYFKKLLFKITTYLLENYWIHQYQFYRKKYSLPKDFRFNGEGVLIYGSGELEIGAKSYIGRYSQIQLKPGTKIKIGENCRMASNIKIYTGSNEADQDFSKSDLVKKIADVTIGDNCWLGANVFIVPGVIIGDNAVVGANSVVTKDIESNTINGGVPCKLIKYKKISA